ncbi:unnamed protein product [Rotaria sp. Silwood2]|nr:unnamed protein product [Rotaria sp. Silwood2]CAF4647173.1 unnamed protein product [Rotaria sp. Silwood2]
MATATTDRNLCDTCGKAKGISKCEGCAKIFCYSHFGDHRQELNKQLDEVEVIRDLYRQTLTEQTADPQRDELVQQINHWESDSIKKIQETAEVARQILFRHTNGHIKQIEFKLNKLTDQLRQSHQENDFVETDLHQWKEQLAQLSRELTNPSSIILRQDLEPLVTKIYVDILTIPLDFTNIGINTRWIQHGITIAGGNGQGNSLNQLSHSWDIYVTDNQSVYVADSSNHRIVEWKCDAMSGQVVAGGHGPGNRTDQLNDPRSVLFDRKTDCLIIGDHGNRRVLRWPRQNGANGEIIISNIDCSRLAMDNDGYLYVSDNSKHEVRRWKIGETNGTLVAGGNGPGHHLNQLNCPNHIFVDHEHSVYVSDSDNHRVMKWMKDAKEGIIVGGGQGKGTDLTQLSYPRGVIVDHLGTVYVSDYGNHRVVRWFKGATQASIVAGGNEKESQLNQLNHPTGLSFDRQGHLYVSDYHNYRVQKFNIDTNSSSH